MAEKNERFVGCVTEVFGFLEDAGFKTGPHRIECKQLYYTVTYCGKEVAYCFSFDVRENYCECYIARVVHGEIITDRRNGGFWSSLYSFLVKQMGYRGKIPIPKECEELEFKELYGYKKRLIDQQSEILKDDSMLFCKVD